MNNPIDFDPDELAFSSGHFIDGEFLRDTGPVIDVFRPSDGRRAGGVQDGDANIVDRAVQSALRAYRHSGWATQPPRARAKTLRLWAQLIEDNVTELARIEAASSTRLIGDAIAWDIPMAADLIRYFAEYADKVEGVLTATASDACGQRAMWRGRTHPSLEHAARQRGHQDGCRRERTIWMSHG
jgi:aldehyde dehydrogenase (NAD+)